MQMVELQSSQVPAWFQLWSVRTVHQAVRYSTWPSGVSSLRPRLFKLSGEISADGGVIRRDLHLDLHLDVVVHEGNDDIGLAFAEGY